MNGESTASPDDDDLLRPIVESFLDRFRRGERPALTELIARHPELAGEIRELIPALVELEQLGRSTGGFDESPAGPTGTRGPGDEGPSPERLGDYAILRRIGGGGMGVVYEAEHESLKNRVALKVKHPRFRADPKYLRRIHAEARLAAGLHHTNIVGVFDYGAQDAVCYYAMQFIEGQPLDHVLADVRRLREDGTQADGRLEPDAIFTLPAGAPAFVPSAAARGLLTGRFAATGHPVAGTTATGEAAAAAVALVAGDRESRPAGLHADEPARGEPSTFGSSSLIGSGELRYFREIARIGAQVADALEYAHRRGVLHRDIKPSNLLLDALGNIWVTDFGLAKLEEGEDLSQSRELVGTLRYMAPERFQGTSDRRGDIYSLGATLYELVALRPLFEESDPIRLIDRIRNDAPAPPRQLDRHIPRDLETIVLKALAREPKDRFGSAGELADELRRYVEGRPIRLRPVSVVERFWRWCKRDPWLAGANIAAAVLTTALALGGTWAALVYRGQRDQIGRDYLLIQQAEAETRKNLFDALLARARATRYSRQVGQRFDALAALDRTQKIARELRLPPDQLESLRDEVIACLALPDLKPTKWAITRPTGMVGITFDPTMTRYALRFHDGTISVRRVADDQEVASFQAQVDSDNWIFRFSPDGRYLAASHSSDFALTVWDVDRRAVAVEDPGRIWRAARFSPDSRRIAAAHDDGDLLVYNLATGRRGRRWPGKASRLAFRPDGAQIAVIDNEPKPPTCRILEGETGQLVRTFPLRAAADDVAWSPDGSTLATPSYDFKIDLWDTTTGTRRATLEGHDNSGLFAGFHPAGTLLASDGWEGRLRLWDPILGQPLLSLTGGSDTQFSRDGRILVSLGDKLILYQVDPALEYRTFAHASHEPMDYANPSIRQDGRVLAVGSNRGAVLWDLARGTELAFLPIGNAWNLMFEPSGDLLTNGEVGVQRWPVHLDRERGEFRIGPPRSLRLPAGFGTIAEDRSSRIVAKANSDSAYVATAERTIRVGPLGDCRSVAISPDGQWLATGSHQIGGAQIWRIIDGTKVAELPIDGDTGVSFSPDGKWLVAGNPRPRLWEVGTWREQRSITDVGACFSPDSRLFVVVDRSQVIRLVEVDTDRTLARLESPDLCTVAGVAFSPDGSRLVVTTKDRPSPAVHVWDLRAIRKDLAGRGLDWDTPAYSEADPANPSASPLPPLQVDFGELGAHLVHFTESPTALIERYTARLQSDANDADAYHHRAHALAKLKRFPEAIDDWTQAIRLRPGDAHYRAIRGVIYRDRNQLDPAIVDLEAALTLMEAEPAPKPDPYIVRVWLSECCNGRAWELANGPGPRRELDRAVELGRRALELAPGEAMYLNTLGVVLYRAGQYGEAIATLELSLAAGRGQFDAFDFFFLAMAHHRLGHRADASTHFDRALRWLGDHKTLDARWAEALTGFRAEAEAVLAGPAGELPEDVFAH